MKASTLPGVPMMICAPSSKYLFVSSIVNQSFEQQIQKTKQNKTKQNKTKQNKTKQNKTMKEARNKRENWKSEKIMGYQEAASHSTSAVTREKTKLK